MIFVYRKWERFCKDLSDHEIRSIRADEVVPGKQSYLILKHDVETHVHKALTLAKIEQKYGHRGSYYVQAYLLENEKNVAMLRQMQEMGHEISYHYDVMDSCRGDLEQAIEEFETNRQLFETNGFPLRTLCQHGNPLVERVGYTSNRDFFRSERVRALYPGLADIMVNYKEVYGTDYRYYSDAGRSFKRIYDPINNDIVKSDDRNIPYRDLRELYEYIEPDGRNMISTHPHRWTRSAVVCMGRTAVFKVLKVTAKLLYQIPFMKKIMNRYYYLAKKV